MMQQRYLWVPLSAALFAFSLTSAHAAIRVNLETPVAGQSASGIGVVRGWAFAENGSQVTVALRLDGVVLSSFTVECCSARQDVQTSVSGAPLETGFGATVNFGDISPAGPHMVGVEVSATGETPVVVNRAVVVVRPGNVPLVGTFDLANASCTVEQAQDQILINNVNVSASGGSPVTTNVRAKYQTEAQALVITEASGGPALTSFKANLNPSQEVPTPTTNSCTGTGTLTLNADNTITCSLTFSNLTGTASAAHIHQSPPGVAGPIIVPLNLASGSGGSPATCPTPGNPLTAEQATALRQGNLYFNVHTAANPAGECRGQIVAGP